MEPRYLSPPFLSPPLVFRSLPCWKFLERLVWVLLVVSALTAGTLYLQWGHYLVDTFESTTPNLALALTINNCEVDVLTVSGRCVLL